MRTSMLAAVAGLLVLPATAAAANPVAESRAAWDRVAGSTFTLDQDALADVLEAADVRELTISVPAPDGGFERFEVVESPVMEPALAAAHPEIKTYTARGVDDPTASARLDLTPLGFHASVRSATGAWYVDPRDGEHVAHRRGAVAARPFTEAADAPLGRSVAPRAVDAGGGPVTLRVYRLALLSDPGFSNKTPEPTTTAAKTVVVNRLNQIFEQDLAIRLVLVAGTDQLNLDTAALASGTGGPCSPASCYTAAQLADCNAETLDRTNAVAGRILGAGSYDLAHFVMGDGAGGGLASLGGVGGIFKGAACTAYDDPVGDPFVVDYLAHEIGHQFGGEHTFDSRVCADNRAGDAAVRVEPGSGSSIMAYAGTCGNDNLQRHSDPYFSQASLAQITAHVTSAEEDEAPAQQVALNGFDTGDGFRLRYAGANSAVVTQGGNFTDDGIEAAIKAIPGWPAGADAFVYDVTPAGFTVLFSGLDAPARLEIVSPSGFPGGFAGVVSAGGLTHYGGSPQATGNRAPSVALKGAAAYTIPARTPFQLDATGSDLDGDTLTYSWEQNDGSGGDLGTPLFSGARNGGPLFRIFGAAAPAAGPANAALTATSRSFPDVQQVLADNTNAATGSCPAGNVDCFSELLPTDLWNDVTGRRTLHFRVTARDNRPGFGGTDFADVALAIAAGTGPFRLTSQAAASTVGVGAALPVTWDVAGTATLAPEVRISLSLDGGRTFTKVLAAATPNDGAETVTVPRVTSANARVKIEGVGNVFYDAARGGLSIDAGAPALLNGPASADLGSALVGDLGAPVTITFTSDGPTPVNTGVLAVGGADGTGVGIVSDGCSGRTLTAYSECALAVRLSPLREGAHAATLTLPSNDPTSPATVALTGTGAVPPPAAVVAATPPPSSSPTPTPPPTAFDPSQSAARLLGVRSPFAFGTAGDLRLFTKTKSAKLGKPKASMLLAAAVCAASPCSGKATAKLTLTPRKGRKRSYNFTLLKSLKLAAGTGTVLSLKLSRTDRKRIDAARKASLVLTVTNGTKKVTRTFTLTT